MSEDTDNRPEAKRGVPLHDKGLDKLDSDGNVLVSNWLGLGEKRGRETGKCAYFGDL